MDVSAYRWQNQGGGLESSPFFGPCNIVIQMYIIFLFLF